MKEYFQNKIKKEEEREILEDFKVFLKKLFEELKEELKKEKAGDKKIKTFGDFLERKIKKDINESLDVYQNSIKNFLLEIKDKVKNNYYDVLIGDDTKGRIPTLILREVFNYYRKKNNLKSIKTLFIVGGKEAYWNSKKFNNIVNYLKNLDLKDRKILLVTEFMFNQGFLKLANVFKFLNLNFDCFSCFSYREKKYYLLKSGDIFKNTNLYIGKENFSSFDLLLSLALILGVVKKDNFSVLSKGLNPDDKKYLIYVRKKIKEISEQLIKDISEK